MLAKKLNLENFNILEPTKSKRKLRHKKQFQDYVTSDDNIDEEVNLSLSFLFSFLYFLIHFIIIYGYFK